MKWLPLIVFALFGYYLVGANFQARLGMIDDHEIPLFLGSDGVINLHEIPSVIASTEVGRWGEYQRFRPAYYTLRVIEAALWRDNARLWYGSRYLMLVLSMYLIWLIASRFFPKIVSYFLVFYLMTQSFWSDLWTRLGPSEIYTVPTLFMFVYGLFTNQLWLIVIGYTVAIGSKENFLFLFPFLCLYAGYRIYQKKMLTKEIYIYVVLMAYTLWIIAGIYLATSRAGTDVYGVPVRYTERLINIYKYKRYIVESRHLELPLLVFAVCFVNTTVAMWQLGIRKILANPVTPHFIFAMAILGVIASQYLFYNNNFPTNMRYDFPVMILFPVIQLIAIQIVIVLIPKKSKAIMIPIIYLCLMMGLGYMVVTRRYNRIRQAAVHNAQDTASFAAKLDNITPILIKNPQLPLVFVSQHYLDYEPIVSVERYLNARGVENKFVLVYKSKNDGDNLLSVNFTERMNMVMRGEQDPDQVFERFSATATITQPCLRVAFGEADQAESCQLLTTF